MELDRKVTVYEKAPWKPVDTLRRVADAHRRHLHPEDRDRRAAPARVPSTSCRSSRATATARAGRARRRARRARARHAHDVAAMAAEVHPTAAVYPGTVLGEGVKVLENAVVGKQPSLSPRSTAKREPLPPTEIGDGTIVSTGAIVFAGSRIGARVILGDQSCVRERVTIGDDVVARPRLARRERHDDRRADEDPGGRVHHRLLDARGERLHRAVRRHDERQLHGPHGAAARADEGADDPPRRARRRRRDPLPRDRDRRGGVRRRRRGRDEGRAAARRSSSATPRGCSATCPRTSCSRGRQPLMIASR